MQPTLGLAFLAGLLSFISPCVLPLVPAYIGYMGGRLTHTVAAGAGSDTGVAQRTAANRFITFLHSIAFVAGFTFIFVVLGLLGTAFVFQVGRQNLSLIENLIARVGGILVIFFGLHFMGVMPRLFNRILARASQTDNPNNARDFLLLSIARFFVGSLLITWALGIAQIEVSFPLFDGTASNDSLGLINIAASADWILVIPVVAVIGVLLFVGGAFSSPVRYWERTISSLQRALYGEVRMQMTARGQQNFATSAIMGVVFAAGWTPCIGPVYGAVLTMAANGGDVGQAGSLLGAYSLGLGIPFLLTALLLDSAQGGLRRIQRHMHTVELVTGGFLVVIGVLVATGQLQRLSATFANQFTDVSIRVEECGLGVATGEVAVGELGDCLNTDETSRDVSTTSGSTADTPAESADSAQNLDDASPALNSITGLADEAAESGAQADVGIERGNLAVNFPIRSVDGSETLLSDLRGKVVLVNFWATWCGPCRVEMPEFERAYQDHADDGLVVVAVNNGESADLIADFREEISLTFPIALDLNGDVQRLYGVLQYPTTLLIDRDGVIVQRHVGPLTAERIESLVSEALA